MAENVDINWLTDTPLQGLGPPQGLAIKRRLG
jgi:hypothetical protein